MATPAAIHTTYLITVDAERDILKESLQERAYSGYGVIVSDIIKDVH